MNSDINIIFDLIKKGNLVEAKNKCIEINDKNNNNSEFFNIFAIILFQLEEYDKSIDKWKKALELNPKYFFAYNNLGNAFLNLKKYNEAITHFNKAIEIKPDFFDALNNKGNALSRLNKYEDALLSYDKAIEIKPDSINGYIFKAHILSQLDRLEEALDNYKNAYIINPEHPLLLGYIVHTKSKSCNWEDFQKDIETIKLNLENEKKISIPFTALTIFDSPHLQKKASEIWVKQFKSNDRKLNNLKKNKKKIRIAYFSADFRDHAIGNTIVGMLESHDKSKFEIYGFYFGNNLDEKDLIHKKIVNTFDKFINIKSMTDKKVADLSLELNIDIAVDLTTHTGTESRFGIFTQRCAPIQLNFLGYPGTSGSKSIDYIIADKTVIPKNNQKFYSEKIVYMPNSYHPIESVKKISEKKFSRKELNLPEEKFVFCCFNSHQKITPSIFNIWINLLKKNSNSVLWLREFNKYSSKNLKLEASKKGLDEKRIIFAKRLPLDEHLSRIKNADLFLDTFPYTAHSTCSDVLRIGLPVLTCMGESFTSRVSASFLNTMMLPELITTSYEEYEKFANKIARDKKYLSVLKNKILENKSKSSLYDIKLFTKNLEKAYFLMFEKYMKGEETNNIEI